MAEISAPATWSIELKYRPDENILVWVEETWNVWITRIEKIDEIYRLVVTQKAKTD